MDFDKIDRRKFIGSTVAGSLIGIAGCSDTTEPETSDGDDGGDMTGSDGDDGGDATASQEGVLATAVSDQPAAIGDFEQLVLSVDEIEVYPASSGGDEETEESTEDADSEEDSDEGGPITFSVDEGVEFDLVQLQGDSQEFINEGELEVGDYNQIKLRGVEVVYAVLAESGESPEVVTPGNAPLMFKQDFEIRPNTRTEFTADFAPHRRGNNGYILRPVAAETTVSYVELEEEESEESDEESNESEDSSSSNSTSSDDGSSSSDA